MGTSGTDRFTDYPGTVATDGTKGGGTDGSNKCDKAIGNILLEEVSNCKFYSKHHNVPPKDTEVRLRETLEAGRLVVDTLDGESVGYLPTSLNYLRQCIANGYKYIGIVTFSNKSKIPTVRIDLGPEE